jgi:4-amino-4-deoxy-L-arabinose transferase-like glycosyltransferase
MSLKKLKSKTIRVLLGNLIAIPNIAAFFFLVITLATAGHYGFFGDELYYFACSKHLDWGYVDHPPMVAILTFISTKIFGETIFSLRLMSGLAGAITVLLSARIAGILGGNKFSQSLAAISVCFALVFPALSSFFSMNPVDIMLCTFFLLLFISTIIEPTKNKWIGLAIIFGAGLLNKYTFLVLGFSLFISLIITRRWSVLKSPWFYFSGTAGFLIFLPHILWQINHSWPTLEFMHNATEYKNLSLSPLAFLAQLIIGLNPFTLPIWISGLLYLHFNRDMRKYRFLGWTAVIFLLIYMIQNSKFYYVAPIFPLLLGAGSVPAERFLYKFKVKWPRWLSVATLFVSGTILMPLAVPVLPVKQFVEYAKTLGLWDIIRMEKGEGDVLPLHYVYRLGWEELAVTIGNAYKALPQNERDSCAVLASWYGIAGAIDHYGPKVGLPNAICPRNSYWLWGTRNYSGNIVLAVGYSANYLKKIFNSVEKVAHFDQKYAYGEDVYLCKMPKTVLKEMWPQLKHFI